MSDESYMREQWHFQRDRAEKAEAERDEAWQAKLAAEECARDLDGKLAEARREYERLKRAIRDTLPTAHPNDHNWVVLVRHLVRSDTQGTQGGKHGD